MTVRLFKGRRPCISLFQLVWSEVPLVQLPLGWRGGAFDGDRGGMGVVVVVVVVVVVGVWLELRD
jgi:hypothetical protein